MKKYLEQYTSAAPLAVFRVALGLLLFVGVIRFWLKGWIYELYIKPKHFFSFYGFEFVAPPGEYAYLLFAICGLSALMVALGMFYRISSISLFLSFTYIELIDKSTYLNHYYFISMICLLMIFLPANAYFSFDSYRNRSLRSDLVPAWTIDSLKVFVCVLYVFAGLAKVNSDWLLHAQPLHTWLPSKNDLPLIGFLFNYAWVAFAFAWIGCLYDLCISFLLWNRSTRIFAYFTVVVFHFLTAILFPIGMFPYVMVATALIFFSGTFHAGILEFVASFLRLSKDFVQPKKTFRYRQAVARAIVAGFVIFFLVQLALPFRYLLYPNELFWSEEGYRFSWRVMLMEKAGYAQFIVKDSAGRQIVVDNRDFLTPLQEKMMATQPDMILQYAHILRDHYANQGFQSPQVYADTYVALNGRLGKPLIDPHTDLAKETDSFLPKRWILPFDNEIKGL